MIRVVLGLVEPFVSIGAERFAESQGVQTLLMEENAVATKSVQAVLDGSRGTVEGPGNGAEILP